MRAFYFGCVGESGHYLWDEGLGRIGPTAYKGMQPWGLNVDDGLRPTHKQVTSPRQKLREGLALLHHKDGWTAVSFIDNSVDKRGGSNSAFLFDTVLSFYEAITLAREKFPSVWARFEFEVEQLRPAWTENVETLWSEDDATCGNEDHESFDAAWRRLFGEYEAPPKALESWWGGDCEYRLYAGGLVGVHSYPGNSSFGKVRA